VRHRQPAEQEAPLLACPTRFPKLTIPREAGRGRRRIGGRSTRSGRGERSVDSASSSRKSGGSSRDTKAIREWAQANGHNVPDGAGSLSASSRPTKPPTDRFRVDVLGNGTAPAGGSGAVCQVRLGGEEPGLVASGFYRRAIEATPVTGRYPNPVLRACHSSAKSMTDCSPPPTRALVRLVGGAGQGIPQDLDRVPFPTGYA
jgi:hypothetical protein